MPRDQFPIPVIYSIYGKSKSTTSTASHNDSSIKVVCTEQRYSPARVTVYSGSKAKTSTAALTYSCLQRR